MTGGGRTLWALYRNTNVPDEGYKELKNSTGNGKESSLALKLRHMRSNDEKEVAENVL